MNVVHCFENEKFKWSNVRKCRRKKWREWGNEKGLRWRESERV
jgi:hypothetical protein